MKNKKLLIMLAMTALAATVFVGCSSSESAPEEVPAVESPQTAEEDKAQDEAVDETEDGGAEGETKLVDGTYRIEYEQANEEGFKTFLEVTVEEGTITAVNFDEVNEANEMNTSDDEEENALEEAFMKATSIEEFEQMIEGKQEAESFKMLAEQLMTQMQEGNTDTIVLGIEENQ